VFVCKITAQNSFIVQKCSFDIYIPHIKMEIISMRHGHIIELPAACRLLKAVQRY
jgi:hypothetical protein